MFFSVVFNFWISVFFTIIVCLKLIGCNKWTKSLVVSNYPLAQILYWKLLLWDASYPEYSYYKFFDTWCNYRQYIQLVFIVYKRAIVFTSTNFLKTFIENWVLDNLWLMDDYNLFFSIESVWNNNLSFLNFLCCNKLKSQQIINCLILSYKFTLFYLYHACNLWSLNSYGKYNEVIKLTYHISLLGNIFY